MAFDTLPTLATLKVEPYTVAVPDAALKELQTALKIARIAPPTFENAQETRRFGLSREWVLQAKERWSNGFDWRRHESSINELPNFKATVVDDEQQKDFSIHFVGLFSQKKDAVPLILLHGWPGSFLEFLPLLNLLKQKYTSETLPYNIVVPSLPGFGFSDRPPVDREFGFKDIARIMNHLMVGLGFGGGYAAQGGDLGSKISRNLGAEFEACKAVHHNFTIVLESQLQGTFDKSALSTRERKGLERGEKFMHEGRAYAQEHATRPATIGLALSASPIALLSWVGEKFLVWSDDDPSLDTILESLTLYWLTDTISTSFYCYRDTYDSANVNSYLKVPYGFSSFPLELYSSPKEWIETTGNLVFYREHDKGGHFAALEQPQALLDDVEEFLEQVWGK